MGHALGHDHRFGHVAQYGHGAGHRAMAVGDGAGGFLHLKALTIGAVQQHAPHGGSRHAALDGRTQRVGQRLIVVRAAQAHHLVHGVACRIKRLPARQAFCHGVEVGHHALRVRADHCVANGLQHQAHALFLVEQLVLHVLALGNIRHLHEEPGDHAARVCVGQVGDDTVPRLAFRVLVRTFKALRCTRQRQVVVGLAGRVAGFAEQLADMPAAHRHRVGAELLECRPVGKAVVHTGIPVGNHRRHVVEDGAQVMLSLGQTRRNLLAQHQLTHEQQRQPKAASHQERSKTTQDPGTTPPLGQDGVGGLGHVQNQGVVAHRPEGVQTLHAVERGLTDKRACALGLKTQQVRRTSDGFADISITIRKAGDHHPVPPKHVDPAVGAQVQRTKQFVEITQADSADHHPGKAAVCMEVRTRNGQDVQTRHP
ncbi:hypothetical protein D3C71_1159770 [compost metagenome]